MDTIFASDGIAAYQSLLLLASGIQMAGPRLTPATFAAGLQRTRFPNPPHPNMAGSVGFAGDYTMTDDGAEWRWVSTARSPYREDPPGAMCYLHGGVRRVKGSWPSDDDLSTAACDTGA